MLVAWYQQLEVREIERMSHIRKWGGYLKHFHENEFHEARRSRDYLYKHVRKHSVELGNLAKMFRLPSTNTWKINRKDGSGSPRAFNNNDEKPIGQKALRSHLKSIFQKPERLKHQEALTG